MPESPRERAARLLTEGAAEGRRGGALGRLRFALAERLAGRDARRRDELDRALLDALDELAARPQQPARGPDDWKGPAAWDRLQPLATAEQLTIEGPDGARQIGFTEESGGKPEALYRGFEEVFRGPESLIREHQRPYVALLRDHPPVLDVGCGRGELLDLLGEDGVEARGVDADRGMAARCLEKGHEVTEGEALAYMESLADGSQGAVFCAHVIEHLPYAQLVRFLELAHRKLAPGGILVAETVNPHSFVALRAFWLDLTHQVPIYPEVALTLCRLQGFAAGRVLFPRAGASGDLATDLRDEDAYAVVATRAGA